MTASPRAARGGPSNARARAAEKMAAAPSWPTCPTMTSAKPSPASEGARTREKGARRTGWLGFAR
eukprot:1718722-Pyramimonas_sp.AAC.1